MPKNQLFKIKPDSNIIEKLMEAFGLEGLNDTRYFTKENMKECNTVDKINNLVEELHTYYLPCKGKIYLDNITEKKSITIFRQFIKPFNYKCMGLEKSVNGQKQMTYRILQQDKEQISPVAAPRAREYVIDFSV